MSESRVEAIRLLGLAADRSHRSSVAYAGIREVGGRDTGRHTGYPPLARLIQGGRGGGTRLPLYLLLTMIATRSPFDIRNPPTAITLARTLDLPPGTGPRRITSNMKWLADKHFIELNRRSGLTPSIQLLDPHGSGRPMSDTRGGRFVSSPSGSGATAGYCTCPRRHRGPVRPERAPRRLESAPVHVPGSPGERQLSHDTWTRGRHELDAPAGTPSAGSPRATSTSTPGCATATGSTLHR